MKKKQSHLQQQRKKVRSPLAAIVNLSPEALQQAAAFTAGIGMLLGTAQVVVDVLKQAKPPAAPETIDVDAEITTQTKDNEKTHS